MAASSPPADDHEALIARRKDLDDSPIPAGQSAACFGLLRLAALTGEHRYEEAALGVIRLLHKIAAEHPVGFGHLLQAIDFHLAAVKEVALVGDGIEPLERVVRALPSPPGAGGRAGRRRPAAGWSRARRRPRRRLRLRALRLPAARDRARRARRAAGLTSGPESGFRSLSAAMSRFLTFAAGRRVKWTIGAVWLVVIAGIVNFDVLKKYADAEDNEATSFLPGDAESTKALAAVKRLQGGEKAAAVVVYRREGGLDEGDEKRIEDDRVAFNALLAKKRASSDPAVAQPFQATTALSKPAPSRDGTAAILTSVITGNGETETILDPVNALRKEVSDPGGGLEAKVTGPAGFSADAIKVFESINGTLFAAAFGLVFVLLILIYRSPLFLWIPLIAVGFAEFAARGVGYGLSELGVTINAQSNSILSVLVLGAGTDYALLLVARYREELRRHQDKHEALALALRTAGPAIFASGLTVIFALLCLSFAEVNGTAGLGPIGAVGIAVAMLSMLTLLPALLVMTGAGRSGARRSSAGATASPTSATAAPTRPTAHGGGSASASPSGRGASGSRRRWCCWSAAPASSTSRRA